MSKTLLTATFAGFQRLPGGNFPFTMVPNQFLDEVVPNEKPCVVKVVCLILRRTVGWIDEKGQRRQQEQVAYTEFAREMNMSIQAVADGLRIALEKGYIVRLKQGSALTGEGAWYSLRWAETITEEKEEKVDSEKKNQQESKKQNLATLKNRDMLKKSVLESKKVEIKANSNLENSEKSQLAKPSEKAKKFSIYIGNLLTEIGQQLGETENHRLPNIKHALNLWDEKTLTETAFAKLLYQARDLTRTHVSAYSDAGSPKNRMPYFFKVLENLLIETNQSFSEQVTVLPESKLETSPGFTPDSGKSAEGKSTPCVSAKFSQLAGNYSIRPELALEKWEHVVNQATGTPLAATVQRAFGIDSANATPALLTSLDLAENQNRTQLDIIIIFQNSFDAHLASNFYPELQNLLQQAWQTEIFLHLTHL